MGLLPVFILKVKEISRFWPRGVVVKYVNCSKSINNLLNHCFNVFFLRQIAIYCKNLPFVFLLKLIPCLLKVLPVMRADCNPRIIPEQCLCACLSQSFRRCENNRTSLFVALPSLPFLSRYKFFVITALQKVRMRECCQAGDIDSAFINHSPFNYFLGDGI